MLCETHGVQKLLPQSKKPRLKKKKKEKLEKDCCSWEFNKTVIINNNVPSVLIG